MAGDKPEESVKDLCSGLGCESNRCGAIYMRAPKFLLVDQANTLSDM